MKTVIYVVSLFIGLALAVGCSQTENQHLPLHEYSKSEADTMIKYIGVENDLYVFKLSKDEALNKGMTLEGYELLMSCMADVNQAIEDARAKGIEVSMWRPDNNKPKE